MEYRFCTESCEKNEEREREKGVETSITLGDFDKIAIQRDVNEYFISPENVVSEVVSIFLQRLYNYLKTALEYQISCSLPFSNYTVGH